MLRIQNKITQKEAIQWTGKNEKELYNFLGKMLTIYGGRVQIETLEGTMEANKGDWIIKGLKGEFYPCKPNIFEQSYDVLCEEKGCNEPAQKFSIEEGTEEYLCFKHATESGFCWGCGSFCGGMESFDFAEAHGNVRGYCEHCSDEIKMDCGEYDDEEVQ